MSPLAPQGVSEHPVVVQRRCEAGLSVVEDGWLAVAPNVSA